MGNDSDDSSDDGRVYLGTPSVSSAGTDGDNAQPPANDFDLNISEILKMAMLEAIKSAGSYGFGLGPLSKGLNEAYDHAFGYSDNPTSAAWMQKILLLGVVYGVIQHTLAMVVTPALNAISGTKLSPCTKDDIVQQMTPLDGETPAGFLDRQNTTYELANRLSNSWQTGQWKADQVRNFSASLAHSFADLVQPPATPLGSFVRSGAQSAIFMATLTICKCLEKVNGVHAFKIEPVTVGVTASVKETIKKVSESPRGNRVSQTTWEQVGNHLHQIGIGATRRIMSQTGKGMYQYMVNRGVAGKFVNGLAQLQAMAQAGCNEIGNLSERRNREEGYWLEHTSNTGAVAAKTILETIGVNVAHDENFQGRPQAVEDLARRMFGANYAATPWGNLLHPIVDIASIQEGTHVAMEKASALPVIFVYDVSNQVVKTMGNALGVLREAASVADANNNVQAGSRTDEQLRATWSPGYDTTIQTGLNNIKSSDKNYKSVHSEKYQLDDVSEAKLNEVNGCREVCRVGTDLLVLRGGTTRHTKNSGGAKIAVVSQALQENLDRANGVVTFKSSALTKVAKPSTSNASKASTSASASTSAITSQKKTRGYGKSKK